MEQRKKVCVEKTFVSTWRNEWISPMESAWSIFEKFRYMNEITNRELLNEFGIECVRTQKGLIAKKYRNLYTLDGIDKGKISLTVNFDIVDFQMANLEMLIGNQKEFINYYFKENLHYCKLCINNGYHSLFHQYKNIENCPYHKIPLLETCYECGTPLTYEIDLKGNRKPFKCICGLNLLSVKINEIVPEWKEFKINNIKDKTLAYWIKNKKNTPLRVFLFSQYYKQIFEGLFE